MFSIWNLLLILILLPRADSVSAMERAASVAQGGPEGETADAQSFLQVDHGKVTPSQWLQVDMATSKEGFLSNVPFLLFIQRMVDVASSEGSSTHTVVILLLLTIFLIPACYFGFGVVVGHAARAGIETFDKDVLGVDVEAESIVFHPLSGILDVRNLIICNPEGCGFQTPYLMRAAQVSVDLDTVKLACSNFGQVVVNDLEIRNVDVLCETKLSGTNVQKVLETLNAEDGKDEKASTTEVQEDSSISLSSVDPLRFTEKSKEKFNRSCAFFKGQSAQDPVELHRVRVQHVGVKIIGTVMGQHPHINLEVADLKWNDFSSQVGTRKAKDILKVLVISILKTVVSNLAGRNASRTSLFQCC
jgi:hypothetical protein